MTTVPFLTLNNGVQILALGFGVFQTPPAETIAAVETALATGYRHIDTAAAYGNEREVGEAIRRSGLDRSEVFVETKIWARLLAETSVVPAVNQIEVHPYFRQSALLAVDAEHGILSQAWSPIGGITFYRDGSLRLRPHRGRARCDRRPRYGHPWWPGTGEDHPGERQPRDPRGLSRN